jgi:DNA-binding transcriptional MerR regulator
MVGYMDLSIGQVARHTGLPVKTIRYYSDIGLVPEARRTAGGYRRYDPEALARLELVRALRDLGLDLDTIARVCGEQSGLEDVARAHADAVDLHIRQMTIRRAVLRAIARGISRPDEVQRMTAFARASADECRRLMDDFLDAVFAGRPEDPFAQRMRATVAVLPEQPSDQQLDAWIELAGLVQDSDFRTRVTQMASEGARIRTTTGLSDTDAATQRAGQAVLDRAAAALASGVEPTSPEAGPIVSDLVAGFAQAAGRRDNAAYRAELARQLAMFSDRRVERYWQLTGVINGWPEPPSMMPAYEWFIAALG